MFIFYTQFQFILTMFLSGQIPSTVLFLSHEISFGSLMFLIGGVICLASPIIWIGTVYLSTLRKYNQLRQQNRILYKYFERYTEKNIQKTLR
jgi:hypothetical protein